MFNNKRAPRNQTQKYKLNQLLDCFTANPYSTYTLQIHKGIIHNVIDQANKNLYCQQDQQESNSQIEANTFRRQSNTKQFGLFANLIKNMQMDKPYHEKQHQKTGKKQRQYEYYFQVFKKKQNIQHQSNDSNMSQQYFQNIHIQQQNNPLNCQEQQINENKLNEGKNKKEPFIDLDFSFDQISNHVQSLKDITNQQQLNQNTITNQINNENLCHEKRSNKYEIKRQLNQVLDNPLKQETKIEMPLNYRMGSINFAKLSKQANKNSKDNSSLHANPNLLSVIGQRQSGLCGTKKVQSRIISNNQSNSINIDFDIDLNFI